MDGNGSGERSASGEAVSRGKQTTPFALLYKKTGGSKSGFSGERTLFVLEEN